MTETTTAVTGDVLTVRSADGTAIAFERVGSGPPVILIGGAFNDRSTVLGLAHALAPQFTAIAYDRRGRGASGDTPPYAVEREVEDIAALIAHAGGTAAVFGHSSGGVLALEAAACGLPISRLAVYETPFVVDSTRPRPAADLLDRVQAAVAAGDRDAAAALFLVEAVAVPEEMVAGMREAPIWPWMTGLAHTLPYDLALYEPGCALPVDRLAKISVPTLAVDGSASPDWMRHATEAVAATVPGARYVTLDGQDHAILQDPAPLLPTLAGFLTEH